MLLIRLGNAHHDPHQMSNMFFYVTTCQLVPDNNIWLLHSQSFLYKALNKYFNNPIFTHGLDRKWVRDMLLGAGGRRSRVQAVMMGGSLLWAGNQDESWFWKAEPQLDSHHGWNKKIRSKIILNWGDNAECEKTTGGLRTQSHQETRQKTDRCSVCAGSTIAFLLLWIGC